MTQHNNELHNEDVRVAALTDHVSIRAIAELTSQSGKVIGTAEVTLNVYVADVATAEEQKQLVNKLVDHVGHEHRRALVSPAVFATELTRPRKPLNHDILERALRSIITEAISLVETSCQLDWSGGPVPGTCDPEHAVMIEEKLDLIRDIESEVGTTEEVEPDWFCDLVDRRWSLTVEAGVA